MKTQLLKISPLSKKIILLLIFLLCFYVIANVINFNKLLGVGKIVNSLTEEILPALNKASEFQSNLLLVQNKLYELLLTDNADEIKKRIESEEQTFGSLIIYSRVLLKNPRTVLEEKDFKIIQNSLDKISDSRDKVLELQKKGQKKEAMNILHEEKSFDEVFDAIKELNADYYKNATEQEQISVNSIVLSKKIYLVSSLAFLMFMSFGFFFFSRSIKNQLLKATQKIYESVIVSKKSGEDLLAVSEQMNTLSSKLSESVQNSASALTEIQVMATQTNNNTRQSTEIAKLTNLEAEKGDHLVQTMNTAMQEIQQSLTQLSEINAIIENIKSKTNVINNIVFKTQILSFNASIEAARAGESGRGFGVVADEVGNLASMSGGAAKDISQLIIDSQSKVEGIVSLLSEKISSAQETQNLVFQSFQEIKAKVKEIEGRMSSIGEASEQQEIGIKQAESLIKNMDGASVSNSEFGNKTLANARSLLQQSENLIVETQSLKQLVE